MEVEFLLIKDSQEMSGLHGLKWQQARFLSFYDLDLIREAQHPLWNVHSHCDPVWSHWDLIQDVFFWAVRSQRGEFIRSKQEVCLNNQLCCESSSDVNDASSGWLHELHLEGHETRIEQNLRKHHPNTAMWVQKGSPAFTGEHCGKINM